MAQLNISAIKEGLTGGEKQMMERLEREIFSQLTVRNWENVEVERYQRDLQEFSQFLRNGPK